MQILFLPTVLLFILVWISLMTPDRPAESLLRFDVGFGARYASIHEGSRN